MALLVIATALLGILLNGCAVPPERAVALENLLGSCTSARETCAVDLNSCQAQSASLAEDRDRWQSIAEADAGRLSALDAEFEACRKRTTNAREQANALELREDMLREKLAKEIASKDVEIERLKDSLALRMLDRILFDSGSAEILPAGRLVLDKVASVLKGTDDYVRVAGHTDNVPIGTALKKTYPSNWELSGARAASVVRYLQEHHGLPPSRLEVAGFSMYRPVADNDSDDGRQRNRRVEITLTRMTS